VLHAVTPQHSPALWSFYSTQYQPCTYQQAYLGRTNSMLCCAVLCGRRGRLSSRAALFGEPDFEEGSSEGGGSDSEQQDEERGRPQFTSPSRLRTVAVSPERDISRVSLSGQAGHAAGSPAPVGMWDS
jgi:hypothetical protein